MPRLPINHANTQIYRFVCNDVNINNTYVGSTTNWSRRKAEHKSVCNNPNNNQHHFNVYQVIRANGGWDNWNMVLVEDYPCIGKREAEQREQYWKEHFNDNMGTKRAFITEEQKAEYNTERSAKYETTHKEQRAEYRAEYRATHKEQMAEYYATHKGQIVERGAAYYATNKEQIADYKAQYRATHKEQMAERDAAYYAINRDQINLKRRQARALKKLKV